MNTTTELPTPAVMLEAFLGRDTTFDGIFVTGVSTTGIFCRPTCPAKKPRPENLSFFGSPHDALLAGFRPCKRCRPLEHSGEPPEWLQPLLDAVEDDPSRKWTDQDVRARGLSPETLAICCTRLRGRSSDALGSSRLPSQRTPLPRRPGNCRLASSSLPIQAPAAQRRSCGNGGDFVVCPAVRSHRR